MKKKKHINKPADEPRSPEDMALYELGEELQRMEKMLGTEQFNRLMEKAIEEFEDPDGEPDDFELDDDDFIDFITPAEWTQTHPAHLVCASDKYYADLASHICDLICGMDIPMSDKESFGLELGRVMAAYLEDLVSETKVFSAMRRVCQERYGYRLPFYDCEHEDYMPDHINEEDIRFLIWKTACLLDKDEEKTYSPLAPGWVFLSKLLFDELDSRYEDAPEATRVADWLDRTLRKGGYIEIREIAAWLVFRNPLCYFPGLLDEIREECDKLSSEEEDVDPAVLEKVLYGCEALQSWQRSMSPMGCPTRTLEAALAKEFGRDSIAEDIEGLEVLPLQIYKVSQDRKNRRILFENSAHEQLTVARESFARGFRPDEIGFAECVLVKYKGIYLLSGTLNGGPLLKAKWESHGALPSYDWQRQKAKEWIDKLDGQQVVCVKNLKVLYNKLGLPEKSADSFPEAENYVVLVSKEMGIAVIPDGGYAFALPDNRFFRKRTAVQDSFAELIFHNSLTHDVALYIQAHHLLPEARIGASQGKDTGHRIVQDYLAFWIGFYCKLPAYGDPPRQAYYEDLDSDINN